MDASTPPRHGRRPRLFATLLAASLVFAVTVGCGPGNPPVAETVGVVTLNGEPLSAGRIAFMPIGGGKHARGTIGPDGRFEMSTFSSGDGAIVGKHHAVIIKAKVGVGEDKKFNFRRKEENRLSVEPDVVNEFALELDTEDWVGVGN